MELFFARRGNASLWLVTSGDKYGTIVTQIDLTLDPKTGDVIDAVANAIVRTEAARRRIRSQDRADRGLRKSSRLAACQARGSAASARLLTLDAKPAGGETPLGQAVIADAQLAATQDAGAQIALMNPGGIRSALGMPADGQLRYEELFRVQPFSNNLVNRLYADRRPAPAGARTAMDPTSRRRGFSRFRAASAIAGTRVRPLANAWCRVA